jgi:hypothetical protein
VVAPDFGDPSTDVRGTAQELGDNERAPSGRRRAGRSMDPPGPGAQPPDQARQAGSTPFARPSIADGGSELMHHLGREGSTTPAVMSTRPRPSRMSSQEYTGSGSSATQCVRKRRKAGQRRQDGFAIGGGAGITVGRRSPHRTPSKRSVPASPGAGHPVPPGDQHADGPVRRRSVAPWRPARSAGD